MANGQEAPYVLLTTGEPLPRQSVRGSMTSLLRASSVCVALASCAGGQSNPMLAPTSTAAASSTLSSLSVTQGAAQLNSQPQRVQMIATGLFSDTARDLTSMATWQSSNPQVATVSTAGLLTVVGDGETTITATYQEMSGSKVLAFMNPSPWDY